MLGPGRFKLQSRSLTGVCNVKEQWIQTFNIGDIMQMSAMSIDELRSEVSDFREFTLAETSKDSLLQKVLQVIVSYFCVGTELRFLAFLNP